MDRAISASFRDTSVPDPTRDHPFWSERHGENRDSASSVRASWSPKGLDRADRICADWAMADSSCQEDRSGTVDRLSSLASACAVTGRLSRIAGSRAEVHRSEVCRSSRSRRRESSSVSSSTPKRTGPTPSAVSISPPNPDRRCKNHSASASASSRPRLRPSCSSRSRRRDSTASASQPQPVTGSFSSSSSDAVPCNRVSVDSSILNTNQFRRRSSWDVDRMAGSGGT